MVLLRILPSLPIGKQGDWKLPAVDHVTHRNVKEWWSAHPGTSLAKPSTSVPLPVLCPHVYLLLLVYSVNWALNEGMTFCLELIPKCPRRGTNKGISYPNCMEHICHSRHHTSPRESLLFYLRFSQVILGNNVLIYLKRSGLYKTAVENLNARDVMYVYYMHTRTIGCIRSVPKYIKWILPQENWPFYLQLL